MKAVWHAYCYTKAGESKRSIGKVSAAANGENRALASLEQFKNLPKESH